MCNTVEICSDVVSRHQKPLSLQQDTSLFHWLRPDGHSHSESAVRQRVLRAARGEFFADAPSALIEFHSVKRGFQQLPGRAEWRQQTGESVHCHANPTHWEWLASILQCSVAAQFMTCASPRQLELTWLKSLLGKKSIITSVLGRVKKYLEFYVQSLWTPQYHFIILGQSTAQHFRSLEETLFWDGITENSVTSPRFHLITLWSSPWCQLVVVNLLQLTLPKLLMIK